MIHGKGVFRENRWLVGLLVLILLAVPGTVASGSGAQPEAKLTAELARHLGSTGSDPVPVIIRFAQGLDRLDWRELEASAGGAVAARYRYPAIDGIAARIPEAAVRGLANSPQVAAIEYDTPLSVALSTATTWFGAKRARADYGLDGSGIAIAIVDTGIDANHIDLAGKIIGWRDFINGRSSPYDDHSHGTHVAGIAAGTGAASGGADAGVAPGASLVGVKVCTSSGSCSSSDVVAGVQWVIDNRQTYNIRVVNLSIGTSTNSSGTDAMSSIVNRAAESGIVAVVAAGNVGPKAHTVGSPGAAARAITVAAMADLAESGFYLASFSSRGPTADGRTKPDIAAPGVNIRAPRSGTANGYTTKSGTSMASPFVAGTAALLLQADPSLTPEAVKSLLTTTALDFGPPGPDQEYGAGRLDVHAAVRAALGVAGAGPAVPSHHFVSGRLSASGDRAAFPLSVIDTRYPLAATLIAPAWSGAGAPNLQVRIYGPGGNLLASSSQDARQDSLTVTTGTTGTFTVEVYSASGSGDFWLDLSGGFGTAAPEPPPPPPAPEPPASWSSGDLETAAWALTGAGTTSGQKDYAYTPPAGQPVSAAITIGLSEYSQAGSNATDKQAPFLEVWSVRDGSDGSLIGTIRPTGPGLYTLSSRDGAVLAATGLRVKSLSLNRKNTKTVDRVTVNLVQIELAYQ